VRCIAVVGTRIGPLREARVELPATVIAHVKGIVEFQPFVFDWPHHERTLWADFATLKKSAGVTFDGAFHRFGFANANVDSMDANLLQQLMRHQDPQTTRHYINAAARRREAESPRESTSRPSLKPRLAEGPLECLWRVAPFSLTCFLT
jgi:integrase